MIKLLQKIPIINLRVAVRSALICCIFVIASKLMTLSSLYSATEDHKESHADLSNDDQPRDDDELPKEPNIQLDNKGLTLKLDFMNLTPQDTRVLESLFNYREKLRKKAISVLKKEDQLKLIEGRIHQQISDLRRIKKDISALLEQHDTQEKKKLTLLVRIYENMKPDQAAKIFNNLPEERVISLLTVMKESKSSAILSNMNPSQASYLTDKILSEKEIKK